MPSLFAPKVSSSYPPAPEGSHVARCVSMIDLGTHEDTGKFGTKRQRKIRLSFELPTELAVFSEEKGEQPYMVHREFTFSLHEKAGLRIFLEGWRGKKFTDEEANTFDVSKLLGAPAMLNVMHNENAGRTYANIGGASRLPKGLECPPQINPTAILSLAEFEESALAALPEWLQQKIMDSDEFKNMTAGKVEIKEGQEEEDDIPF